MTQKSFCDYIFITLLFKAKLTMKIKVIHKEGHKPIKFHEGGLHATTHTPMGDKIPESKIAAAKRGEYGKKGIKQVAFMHNVLKH